MYLNNRKSLVLNSRFPSEQLLNAYYAFQTGNPILLWAKITSSISYRWVGSINMVIMIPPTYLIISTDIGH